MYVTVQLTDSNGAPTTAGTDGTSPAVFEIQRGLYVGRYMTAVRRNGSGINCTDLGQTNISSRWTDMATGTDGSLAFSIRAEDPNPAAGTTATTVFVVRAYPNAPGATGNDGTTPAIVGIIRHTEPSG